MFRDLVFQAADDAVEHLGEPVVLLNDGREVLGIFSMPSELTELVRRGRGGSTANIATPMGRPVLRLREIDAVTLARGSILSVRGESFVVSDRFPAGSGLVRLELSRAQETNPSGQTAWK